jgi:HD-GYP domain-containing protein (c-di-GMP phosphodiesterase class II)
MLRRNFDITDTSVFISGEHRECHKLLSVFRDKEFKEVAFIPGTRSSELIRRIQGSDSPGLHICCVLYCIDNVQEIKTIRKLSKLEHCGIITLVPPERSDLPLKLLQKTDLRDVEQMPVNPDTLFIKVEKILIRLYMQHRIIESNKRNKEFFLKILRVMAKLLEERDEYTEHHSENVAAISCAIAKKLGYSPEELSKLEMAGLLHDFGKIGITDKILNKPGKLTDEEYEVIKRHPAIAQVILEPVQGLEEIIPWIKYHHERWDGSGYPDGISGENIPLPARIMAVADAYDTMHSRRTYHEPFEDKKILSELVGNKGTQFDPEVVDVFLDILEHEELELITEEAG